MIHLEKKARNHWTKYLPGLTAELKKQGIFEREIKAAARMATKEHIALVRSGTKPRAATEIVMKEYILLDPETTE